MRCSWLALIVGTFGCGAAPPSAPATSPVDRPAKRTPVDDAPPIDPIEVLAPPTRVSWIVPGRVQIELGATAYEAPGGTKPIQVTVFDRQGRNIRVAVRLEHARFSLWTDRPRLMALLERDQRVSPYAGGSMAGDHHVILRTGSKVTRLAKKDNWTQVRYFGALQVEGWVPDDALGDSAAPRRAASRAFARKPVRNLLPGAVIRSEPRFGARELAVMVQSYILDTVRDLDPTWVEVSYADADVTLRGVVSRRDPPGRVHRPKEPEAPLPTVIANAKVASGTCLYTRRDGEPVGYVVGDRDVSLEPIDARWWSLAIDSPWGPLTFAARGPSPETLTACAPDGAVSGP